MFLQAEEKQKTDKDKPEPLWKKLLQSSKTWYTHAHTVDGKKIPPGFLAMSRHHGIGEVPGYGGNGSYQVPGTS